MYCSIIIDSLFIFSFLLNQIYFKKNVSVQKISIYKLQEKPLQLITLRTRSANDSKSFCTVSFEILIQAVCNALINTSTLLIVNFNNLLSIVGQIFSIIFISGLFAGQIICLIRFLFKQFLIMIDTCGCALSCW